LAPVELID
jgi:hypothetical protein